MEQKKEAVTELRVRLRAKWSEQKINIEKECSNYFFISYSTLNRRLKPDSILESHPVLIEKLATFLEATEKEVLIWHKSTPQEPLIDNALEGHSNLLEKTSIENTKELDQATHTQFKASSIKLLASISMLFILTVLAVYHYASNNLTPIQNSGITTYAFNYSGTGIDIDIALPDFHSELFRYEFSDLKTIISGENITIDGEILYTSLTQENVSYIGDFSASGKYLSGRAALTYKVTIGDNQEAWIGTMMLDLPTEGKDARGYWLTIHTDPDDKSFGEYAFGNANFTRKLINLQTEFSKKASD